MLLRAMNADDLPVVLELWSRTEGVELDVGDSPAEIVRFLERNAGLSTVALDGERIVGAVQCGHDGRRGWLYHLAVGREQRGRGIARAMVRRCLESLRAAGIRRALLFYSAGNEPGHAFWLREGWEDMPSAKPMAMDL